MTWQAIVLGIGVVGIIVGVLLLVAMVYVLLTGADKRYYVLRKQKDNNDVMGSTLGLPGRRGGRVRWR